VSTKKVKVFLGAYINQTNAQNLNCLALAKKLDKQKYSVYTISIKHGNLGMEAIDGVRIFQCNYPVKLTSYLGFLWGILKCNVAYLPRGNNYKYQRMLLKIFKRRSFKTIENIIDDEALKTALSVLGPIKNVLDNYTFCNRNFSITNFMKDYNEKRWGLVTDPDILPLITDTDLFKTVYHPKSELRSFIFIGNDMARKGVEDYIKLAAHFKRYSFHIVGSNSTNINIAALIQEFDATNVVLHGLLKHESLLSLLKTVQLHILPSRSEGFPRSIIETASAGIATLTYSGYGAEEWIKNGDNGFVIHSFEDLISEVRNIETNGLLETLSSGSKELAKRFDANHVVSLYERVIDSLYNE